jgi:nucleoside-diphosphate-sugar epimerase
MKFLLTGASGFLGKNITHFLGKENIVTVSRNGADVNCNLATEIPALPCTDVVIHAAGQAHVVPVTDAEKKLFFDVNVTGTAHLLKALELAGVPKHFIFISTVAVYGKEKGSLFTEDEPLDATDPYGKSKIEAEKMIKGWCTTNGVVCTILRLPLIAGSQPKGNLFSMIKGIQKGVYFNIGGGKAKRSIVMANDVAAFIASLPPAGTYNLTDGYHPSFAELSENIAQQLHKKRPMNLPNAVAVLAGWAGDIIGSKFPVNSYKLKKMVSDLTFSDARARENAGWKPGRVLDNFKIDG